MGASKKFILDRCDVWYRSGLHDNLHEHYVYDGLNRRIIVEYGTVALDQNNNVSGFTESATKCYAFAGTVPVIEYDYDSGEETLTIVRQYYWGLGLPGGNGALLYMKAPGDPASYYYYHYDGSCNVTCITDADKEIKALYEYDAFGNIITKCGSLANDFLFSTQMANTSSGWYMYMFRSYSPSLGRWTQRDPIGFAGDDFNLYGYCGNNSTNIVDIDGECWNIIVGGVIGGVVGALKATVKGKSVWRGALGGAVTGAAIGATMGLAAGLGAGYGALVGGVGTSIANGLGGLIEGDCGIEIRDRMITGAITGALGGGLLGWGTEGTSTFGQNWNELRALRVTDMTDFEIQVITQDVQWLGDLVPDLRKW